MRDDPSAGWEAVAGEFEALRSNIGADVVLHWARDIPRGAEILDIGCGTGWPIATGLASLGLVVSGVDPSPTLLAAFHRNLPSAAAACETAQSSSFFGRRFDAAIAIGLIFLLDETDQRALIRRVRDALHRGGRFLFSAPEQPCGWADSLTGRPSRSLGASVYHATLLEAGFELGHDVGDTGGNHYFTAIAV